MKKLIILVVVSLVAGCYAYDKAHNAVQASANQYHERLANI